MTNPFDIVTCDRYEYLEDVMYTYSDNYTISSILDLNNIYVKGHKIDLEKNTIDNNKFIFCSSVDYVDYDTDDDEYSMILNACKIIFDECSLLSLDDIEQLKIFESIKFINSLTLSDVKLINIATVLEMSYKSLSASKDKEKYLNLYKQNLIEKILA